jgi:MFS family permease
VTPAPDKLVAMERGTAFAPLRVANFRWYFAALTVNLTGSMMSGVAVAFAVLEMENSPSVLGVVLAAETIPMVLLLLFGGVVADRLPRVLVLRAGNVIMGLARGAFALLVITDTAELWMLILLQVVVGSCQAVIQPALAGLMPQLVPREVLQQANVLQSMVRGGLRVLGPTVAALLVVTVGPGWAVAVDAITWLLAAAMLVRVKLPPRERDRDSESTLTELREGWSLFVGTTWLWVIVLVFGILNAIHIGALFTLGPVVAKDTIGEQGWGLVLSAESVGLLAMTVVLLRFRLERPLLLGMLGCSLLSVPIVMLGADPRLVALVLAAFVGGAGLEVFSLGWSLAMQENVEERMLSRAYSYDMLGSFVAIPIGQLAFGPLGEAFGYSDVLVVSGIVYAAVALSALLSPSVRNLRRAQSTQSTQ